MSDSPRGAEGNGTTHNSPAPTTSSSTNVIVPTVPAIPRSPYLEFDGILFLFGGLFAAMLIMQKVFEFFKLVLEFMERKKKKDKEQDAPLEARLKVLEDNNKNFRPKEDLEREFKELGNKLDHEKAQRRMIQEGFNARLQAVEGRQADIQLTVTKIEARVETVASNAQRVEEAVGGLRARVDERFDRMHEMLVSLTNTKHIS